MRFTDQCLWVPTGSEEKQFPYLLPNPRKLLQIQLYFSPPPGAGGVRLHNTALQSRTSALQNFWKFSGSIQDHCHAGCLSKIFSHLPLTFIKRTSALDPVSRGSQTISESASLDLAAPFWLMQFVTVLEVLAVTSHH